MVGKEYETSDKKKRRAVYMLSVGTPEQMQAIKAVDKGFCGDWDGNNPFSLMRKVQALGIEIAEEEELPDGRWVMVDNPDVAMTTMQTGAL